jgi:hypothetical protein
MKTILKATGQRWKIMVLYVNSAIMALLFIGMFFIDLYYPDVYQKYLIFIGIFGFSIVVFAYVFASVSIKCPHCSDKWFWRAISKVRSENGLKWLNKAKSCPVCDYGDQSVTSD